ncbi:hypothetical protein D3C81_2072880 [compost metagenome]
MKGVEGNPVIVERSFRIGRSICSSGRQQAALVCAQQNRELINLQLSAAPGEDKQGMGLGGLRHCTGHSGLNDQFGTGQLKQQGTQRRGWQG